MQIKQTFDLSGVNALDICTFAARKLHWISLLLQHYAAFNLQSENNNCTQSRIHFSKWLNRRLVPMRSLHSTSDSPPDTPYGRCWEIYGCHTILLYYPITVHTSGSAAFFCRQLVFCTIFILLGGRRSSVMLHHHLVGSTQAEWVTTALFHPFLRSRLIYPSVCHWRCCAAAAPVFLTMWMNKISPDFKWW